jgi:CDK inhibitor PHO81
VLTGGCSYINYKALKKLIKALETGSPRGPGFVGETQYPSKQSALQANKAAFFFRLERELEKVNAFYLQKEAEVPSSTDKQNSLCSSNLD